MWYKDTDFLNAKSELINSLKFKKHVKNMTNEQFYSRYNMLISSGRMTRLGEEVQLFLHEESRRRSKGPEQG